MDALKLTGSEIILKLVISIFCREKEHACEESLQRCLVELIKKWVKLYKIFYIIAIFLFSSQSKDKQKPLVDIPYRMLYDKSFSSEIKLSILERICLPLLRSSSSSAIIEFFLNHVCRLAEIADGKLNKVFKLRRLILFLI